MATETASFKKTSLMRQIEWRHPGQPIERIIAESIARCESIDGAAQELGISRDCLRLWIPLMGIVTKTRMIVEVEDGEAVGVGA